MSQTLLKRWHDTPDRDAHAPLLGAWLVRLTLAFGWHRQAEKETFFSEPVLVDGDYVRFVGEILPTTMDEDGDVVIDRPALRRLGLAGIEQRLLERLERLEEAIDPKLPLLRNSARLARLLGLSRAEVAVLRLGVALVGFRRFHAAVAAANQPGTLDHVALAAAAIGDVPKSQVLKALRPDGMLYRSGLVRVDPAQRGSQDLEGRFDVMGRLPHLLLAPHLSADELMAAFVRPVTRAARCALEDFPHLAEDAKTVTALLSGALTMRARGVNVLLYGPPGTGKTEFAQAVAKALGVRLVETPAYDEGGEPVQGQERLRAYALAQSITARAERTLMLLDEAEDVLPTATGWIFFGGEESPPARGNKAWINWLLENNPVPTIWITNDASFDPAYLRRFAFAVRFPLPPEGVRLAIARQLFAGVSEDEEWLRRLVAHEEVSPALLAQAAAVARWVAADPEVRASPEIAAERALRAGLSLTGASATARLPAECEPRLAYFNTDVAPERLVEGLRRRPAASLCFFGPPGTGKSELARWLARALERPVIAKRGSDLLSKWVGESEKAIAAMFWEAREQGALLLLDEADSFLADRRTAHAHWEVSLTNELLTQMEAFDGLFVCTTNLVEQLDGASLRRFAFKVRFDFLTAEQRVALFVEEAIRWGVAQSEVEAYKEELRQLERLTPGDFATALRRLRILGEPPSAAALVRALREEVAAKGGPRRPVGFV
ncbi:MAG: AAA family ATPase [Hydrogenophilus sp.]|nr:AAA family ATPase [Hydrogenophilus sp.]